MRAEAMRWVRKKRFFYTLLAIYVVLSLMWIAIDLSDGTENLWFYWPMLGMGIGVAFTGIALFGFGSLFGADWEKRQVDRYLQRHGGSNTTDDGPGRTADKNQTAGS